MSKPTPIQEDPMQAADAGPQTLWFTTTRARILVAEDTYSLVEEVALHGDMPPLHVHHDHDEVFYVMSGRLSLHLPGSSVDFAAGEATFAPRGVPHTYRVESDEGARWLVSTTSGQFAAFVAEVSSPADGDGYAPPDTIPDPGVLAAAAARAGIEVLGPPGALPDA
jgi:mannose-6-phosphate isomerase-like protein (cupin superfamily)